MSAFTPPTHAEARAAMDALGPVLLEDVAAPAVNYINGCRAERGEPPLSVGEVGQALGAVALAVQAHKEQQTAATERTL